MTVDIAQLRADLLLSGRREGWTDEETRELGRDIKDMIDRDDQESLAYWALQLSWWRLMLAETSAILRRAV